MSNVNKDSRLFQEFPPVSREQWEAVIKEDLKGADYDKKLVWKTNEGVAVQPYYRAEDVTQLGYLDALPGEFPYARGQKINKNQWYIRQDIEVKNFASANTKAIEIIKKGATSIGFMLDCDHELQVSDVQTLLKGIDLTQIELNVTAGPQSQKFLTFLNEYIQSKKIDPSKVEGSLGFDPFGYVTVYGNFCKSLEYSMNFCSALINLAKPLPKFRVIAIKGYIFHNSGATAVEELAFSLAHGVEYISQLEKLGLGAEEVAGKLKFNFAVGSNYFMEIAKVRAARILWANILKSFGVKSTEVQIMRIHSVTSDWNKTVYDTHVNLLRTTTEAMAAVLGGTDSLTVKPFDFMLEKENPFSERIARNQQLVIKEEAYFDRVVDPASGSYYIETLTNSLAEAAWALFVETEEKGGYLEAFKKSFIQQKVNESARKRDTDIVNRRETILGTNQYPNFNEKIEKQIDPSILESENLTVENALAPSLKPYRGAMAFEALRYKTDVYSMTHKRPKAFMFAFGNLAMRRARAQFACNFFACAGFETIDTIGFKTIDEGVKASLDAKADIVVICSSDEEYAQIAPEIFEKLNGKAIVVLAGYPKDILEQLQAAGIKNFIHVRSNVLDTLKEYQKMLGI